MKRIEVIKLKEHANNILAQSTLSPDYRRGIMEMVEFALMAAKEYKGFGYLNAKDVPPDQLPGIKFGDGGNLFEYPDETRVRYI